MMEMDSFRLNRAAGVLLGGLALFGLYLTSSYSYLLFHSLAEIFSIVVAFGIFVIFWNARRFVDNSYFLFVGIAYLSVGILDLFHTLAYTGMGVFPGSDTNLATQLWIAARYVQSISLLLAPLFIRRKLRADLALAAYTMGVGLLLGAIFYWDIFPVCFVEGVGLTPFKVVSEYVISLILLASLALLYRQRREFETSVLRLLTVSIILAVASGLAFTQYAHAYAVANMMGHLLKIVSFYLVYKAVVETALVKPYDLLFRDLKREGEALQESEHRYRELVENLDDVIYTINKNGVVTYISPAVESLIGYTPQEVVGRPFLESMLSEDIQATTHVIQRILSGEFVGPSQYRVLAKSGEVRWIRTSSRPIFAEDQVIGLRGVLSDITERKWAEEELGRYAEEVTERVKELDCLYGISALVEKPGLTLEETLQGVVELIPPAWRNPEIACARLSVEDQEYRTDNYEETAWRQTTEIAVSGVQTGTVQVCYLEERPELHEGPFLQEERRLLDAIAERLGRIIEGKRAEERLVEAKEAAEKAQRAADERRQEAERRRRAAESLADIMTVLNSNQPLSEVLDYITSQAGRLLDNDAVAIYRVEDEGRLSIRAAQGLPLTYTLDQQAPIGRQALEQAIASGKAIVGSNLGGHASGEGKPPRDAESEPLATTSADLYESILAAPITSGDEPYGGIALYYSDPRDFTQEETELATVFADQIGLAIENARLRDQVREAAAIAERERLARDLHDAVTQTLFSASLIAETLPRIWERSPERAEEGLEELRKLTQGALAEMRTLLLELRPASLTDKPLAEILGHLTQAVTSRSRTPVTLMVEGDSSLPAEIQVALYRIAQEALNNVAKHAAATEVSVRLNCEPGRVLLSIEDDGRGFDASEALPDQLGLRIMRERAETIGATLEISSDPGQGTQVRVDWEETARRRSNE